MKYVFYYRVPGGTRVNRDYPDLLVQPEHARVEWERLQGGARLYLQHELHDAYTTAYANAGMVGGDPDAVRDWLAERVDWLNKEAAKKQPVTLAPNTAGHVGSKPGDIVRDQHGRSGRVPQVELEVFRHKPISSDKAMDAVRDFCKGGGGDIPKGVS